MQFTKKLLASKIVPSYCDDIQKTVAELKSRGVEFTEDVSNQGFGWVTRFKMPGGVSVQLYQPMYSKGGSGR